MSHIVNDELMSTINETLDWARDMGEAWVGTTTGRIIDSEKENLVSLVRGNNLELASVAVLHLAQTCQYAQDELEKMEII